MAVFPGRIRVGFRIRVSISVRNAEFLVDWCVGGGVGSSRRRRMMHCNYGGVPARGGR